MRITRGEVQELSRILQEGGMLEGKIAGLIVYNYLDGGKSHLYKLAKQLGYKPNKMQPVSKALNHLLATHPELFQRHEEGKRLVVEPTLEMVRQFHEGYADNKSFLRKYLREGFGIFFRGQASSSSLAS